MKQLLVVLVMAVAIAGCKDRVIWNDNGKLKEASQDREVWDSEGKLDSGERKIWNDQNDEPVVK